MTARTGFSGLSIEPSSDASPLLNLRNAHEPRRAAQLPADLPDITADATRTAEALLNLGSNAIKYNHPGGHVEFSAERIPGGFVRLKVLDDGIGIPEDQQPRLFQEFNRLGAEQTDIEGTGIGLVLTRRLAELMHGAIGFTSATGKGSTFWVDLPIERGRLRST